MRFLVGCIDGVQRVCRRMVAILFIETFMTFDFDTSLTSRLIMDSDLTQCINESANFRFPQRLSVIFGLLPAETTVHESWFPAETVRGILLRQETNHTDSSAGSYLPSTTVSAGSKRSQTVSAEAKYDGQSLQEA